MSLYQNYKCYLSECYCGDINELRELSDNQWKFIKPHLPPQPITGRKRADDRKVINGILLELITDCRLGDMPAIYGSQATAWRRPKRWSQKGIWNKIMEALRDSAYQKDKFSMDVVCVDSSFIETVRQEARL